MASPISPLTPGVAPKILATPGSITPGIQAPQSALLPKAAPPPSVPASSGVSSFMPMIMQLFQTLVSLVNSFIGGSGQASKTPAASPSSGSPAPASSGGASGSKPNIVVIDSFSGSGASHGNEIVNTILQGGPANIQKFDLGDSSNNQATYENTISNALDQVIKQVQSGQKVDAVNLSQQIGGGPDDATTQKIRQQIQQLSALGVPVDVAAGNNGPNTKNLLADNSGFVVESGTNGKINKDSGIGNILENAPTTSFATAELTGKVAALKASGLSLDQIKQQLGAK